MNPQGAPERQPNPEVDRTEHPRIYVASLSDYNNGHLHGAWIDTDQPPDDIHAGIQQMLAGSRYPTAEEWAIHDFDGFYSLRLGEYENIEHLAMIGQGIAEHGPAFAAWAEVLGSARWEEELDDFEEVFRGEWDSMEAYAEDLLADFGVEEALDQLGDWLRPYITVDVEAFARDVSTDLNLMPSPGGGVYLFD